MFLAGHTIAVNSYMVGLKEFFCILVVY